MVQLYDYSKINRSSFGQAQVKGTWVKWINVLKRRPNDLLSFQDVQNTVRLSTRIERGLQYIELDQIVGSVGRTHDFSRDFYPRDSVAETRWESVNRLFYGVGLSPIEVYKVSNIYFVLDGHHRVSVCRSNRTGFIEAYVTEFHSPISINNYDDLNSISSRLRQSRKSATYPALT
ncbi:MAG: hypothetical protein KDI79_20250 [Anaerolineae bacterium]|nr:hypothetical protein [Anaerolineae bacterium]